MYIMKKRYKDKDFLMEKLRQFALKFFKAKPHEVDEFVFTCGSLFYAKELEKVAPGQHKEITQPVSACMNSFTMIKLADVAQLPVMRRILTHYLENYFEQQVAKNEIMK